MYYKGQGVPKNDGEAFRYFQLAADQGYAQAIKALEELKG